MKTNTNKHIVDLAMLRGRETTQDLLLEAGFQIANIIRETGNVPFKLRKKKFIWEFGKAR